MRRRAPCGRVRADTAQRTSHAVRGGDTSSLSEGHAADKSQREACAHLVDRRRRERGWQHRTHGLMSHPAGVRREPASSPSYGDHDGRTRHTGALNRRRSGKLRLKHAHRTPRQLCDMRWCSAKIVTRFRRVGRDVRSALAPGAPWSAVTFDARARREAASPRQRRGGDAGGSKAVGGRLPRLVSPSLLIGTRSSEVQRLSGRWRLRSSM